jgi:hypothetical protein
MWLWLNVLLGQVSIHETFDHFVQYLYSHLDLCNHMAKIIGAPLANSGKEVLNNSQTILC